VETTGTTPNRGRFINWSTKPVHTRDKKTRNLIVTAHDWCGLRQYNGKFVFSLQKYQFDAQETNYLTLTNQLQEGYLSPRLQELCGYYSNRISYEEVALLVERVSGERLLSDQKIGQIVSTKALQFSQEIYKSTSATLAKSDQRVVKVNPTVDIYQPESKEILLFDDGIQVKRHKEQRQAKDKLSKEVQSLGTLVTKTPDVMIDIVLLQKSTGEFEYVAAPINASGEDLLTLANVVKAKVIQEYGSKNPGLNLVAITDGARASRHRLLSIFGVAVTVILD
jgi:hypothetical protein